MSSERKKFTYALPADTVLAGRRFKYRITRVLGQGGFGITYHAKGVWLDENIAHSLDFAIKEFFVKDICHRDADGVTMLYGEGSRSIVTRALDDFKSEAAKLVRLCKENAERARRTGADSLIINNRHIVPVNEMFECNGTAYFVMAFLEGGSLRDMVAREGVLDESRMLDLMRPIISAVDYLHRQRIMHLDIKPDNIVMRGEQGALKAAPMLIDFGLSLHFDGKGQRTSMSHGSGYTPGYASLEQMSGVSEFDPRLDVYSLGATMYFLLTGRDPLSAVTMSTEVLERDLSHVSQRVRDAICAAMSRDPSTRTPTASRLLLALDAEPDVEPECNTVSDFTEKEAPSSRRLSKTLTGSWAKVKQYLPMAVMTLLLATITYSVVRFKPWQIVVHDSLTDDTIAVVADSTDAVTDKEVASKVTTDGVGESQKTSVEPPTAVEPKSTSPTVAKEVDDRKVNERHVEQATVSATPESRNSSQVRNNDAEALMVLYNSLAVKVFENGVEPTSNEIARLKSLRKSATGLTTAEKTRIDAFIRNIE